MRERRGVLSVKGLRWIIVFLGMLLICVSSIAVRGDDPDTAYNESETPVNLILVSLTGVATTNLTTVEHPITISRKQRLCRDAGTTIFAITSKRALPVSHSCLNLYCTLLC